MSEVTPITRATGIAWLREHRLGEASRIRVARRDAEDLNELCLMFRTSVEEANAKHQQMHPTMDDEEWERYREYLWRRLNDPRHLALLAGWRDGCIFAELIDLPFGKPHTVCQVSGLWTRETERRTGLAMELTSAAAQWAESQGVHVVQWTSLGRDTKWTDRGFVPVATLYATTWISGKAAELAYQLERQP
jgi:GNAT superfamily N-acetyltransferase